MKIWTLLATIALLAVAGCVSKPQSLSTTTEPAAAETVDDPVFATAANCVQGASVLAYDRTEDEGRFQQEDVRPDFPDGRVGTMGVPVTGPTRAIYSSFVNCYEEDQEFLFGFVGMRVLAPEWDHDGIERHFVVYHLFYGNPDSSHHLAEWLGIHVDPLVRGEIRLVSADTYRLSYSTGTNMGDYDQIIEAPPVARQAPTTIRLWAPSEDPTTGRIQYRAIDIQDTFGEAGSQLGASGTGFMLHWKNDLHGPSVAGQYVSAAGQPTWSEHYSGFSRSLSYGPTGLS